MVAILSWLLQSAVDPFLVFTFVDSIWTSQWANGSVVGGCHRQASSRPGSAISPKKNKGGGRKKSSTQPMTPEQANGCRSEIRYFRDVFTHQCDPRWEDRARISAGCLFGKGTLLALGFGFWFGVWALVVLWQYEMKKTEGEKRLRWQWGGKWTWFWGRDDDAPAAILRFRIRCEFKSVKEINCIQSDWH